MTSSCTRHPFARVIARCVRCDDAVCRECHVEAKGRHLCLDCALALAGVRTSGRSAKAAAERRRQENRSPMPALDLPPVVDLRDAPPTRPSTPTSPIASLMVPPGLRPGERDEPRR